MSTEREAEVNCTSNKLKTVVVNAKAEAKVERIRPETVNKKSS
jgi:hypothetical protein